MSWDEKLAGIIDYVEEHLQRTQDDIDKKEIEKLAECSYTFFLKVFSYMYGIGFGEYIRNRKLTLAGYDLKSTDDKVIDISYRYGYDSPTSFTKAFQQFHGVTPKVAKTSDVTLRVYPKMKIDVGRMNVSWSLRRKPAFRLLGKAKQISNVNGNNYIEIPAFWSECQQNGEISRIVALDDAESKGTMGLCYDFDQENNQISYAIAVVSQHDKPEDFVEVLIPEATWAVFVCKGTVPKAIQDGWTYLNSEWYVKYPFAHADCPEIEWYPPGNTFSSDYVSEIWIPIIEEEKA